MKAQTSLEFMIILGAISLVSLTTITLYKGNISKSDQLFSNILSENALPTNQIQANLEAPQVLIYLPSNSTLNEANRMEVAAFGCPQGALSLSINSSSLDFPEKSANYAVNDLSIIPIYFTPLVAGFGIAVVNYTYSCSKAQQASSYVLTTYSKGISNSTASGGGPTAYIGDRNESVVYALSNDGKIASLEEFGHCTYASMFGPTGIEQQCGTSDAWSYSTFSSYCYSTSNYYTSTTCIVPLNTSYGMYSTDTPNSKLEYSFRLDLYYNPITISSNLSNNSTAQLFSSNKNVGTAEVKSATDPEPLSDSNLISNNGKESLVNPVAYSQYLQAKDNLYSTLSFYNQSEVSTDIQSSIESAVSAYTRAANNLINSTTQQNPLCTSSNLNYTCKMSSPFSYQINATLSGLDLGNTTISYLGSAISVISK